MLETILWYVLLLAIGVGLVFTMESRTISVTNGIKEKNKKKKTETENHRAVKPEPPVQPAISAKPVVRGYDSRDLFWEDALIRIREVRRKIASDLKKED
jgi:hypothetical protein